MAEYIEVMKQKRRMCNYYALCIMGCPLNDIDFCNKNSGEKTNADFPEVERRVMSWAAEHPEPVYPTWEQYLADLMTADMKADKTDNPNSVENYMRKTQIPADIAEKLGIEPKEV